MQTTTFLARIRSFFTKKKIIWTVIILVIILLIWHFAFGRSTAGAGIQTGVVTQQDLQKTVLTTGQVVSSVDLDLSFQTSGVVTSVKVNEGDAVSAGQVLGVLDQSTAIANLASAKANYAKVQAAATTQDVAVSQSNVDAATTALQNAQDSLSRQFSSAYNSANTAVLSNTNILFASAQSSSPQFGVSGTVQTNQQLVSTVNSERVDVNNALLAWQKEITSSSSNTTDQLTTDSLAYLTTISNYLADTLNLLSGYTQVTSGGSQTTLTTYQTGVASAKSTVDGLSTSLTTYNQAVRTAEASLEQAQATLALKQAPARPEDVAIAQAQVISAQTALDNTVLRAPASGTVTQVDIKLGEQATAMKEVFMLQNVNELHEEALVSEADIASVAPGQTIDNTFDAFGPDQHFSSTVLTVNPASTVISGVVNYKVTGDLKNIPNLKPGMTANMTILVAEKKNVLAVPSSAIINQDGNKIVKVIDDPKTKTYHSVEIQTGLEADGGLTEVLSGLSKDQQVVTYIKQ